MAPVPLPGLQPSRDEAIKDWLWLDQDVLRSSRSRQVCMTCHIFRLHLGLNGIPLLTCHLDQGLMAPGEHLTHRCSGWTEDLHRLGLLVSAAGAQPGGGTQALEGETSTGLAGLFSAVGPPMRAAAAG